MRARKAIWINGVRAALGLGRGWPSKVMPVLLFIAVITPAVVISIVASQIGLDDLDLPGHAGYYSMVSVVLILFAAIIAPELLCSDRRNRVIDLYLVRPLTTTDYIAGRWLAFFSVTLALVYIGQIVLLIGLVLASDDPLQHLQDNWLDIPRFLGAGVIVAIFITTVPMAVSAFTTRRAYAAAFVIGLFIISFPISAGLTECVETERTTARGTSAQCERPTGDAAKWFTLIDFAQVPAQVNSLIFEESSEPDTVKLGRELNSGIRIGWYALLTIGPGLVLWWRYRGITV
ncbi:MAG: ABC transporter permease subunit [Chloroflexi bacterium]|nr:ABC transporter permease subunit [Chloroflexota bacterium]